MSNRLPPEIARALLDKLENDDGFRARFSADARAALKSLGYEVPGQDENKPDRDPVLALKNLKGGLASKGKISASRKAMQDKFDAQGEAEAKAMALPFAICGD